MKNIWLISDTHFGHENIIKYCNRPFSNAKEMDEALVENWNSYIKPGDKVYHLGDVYMGCTKDYIEGIFKQLNGQKRLILGNHDNGKDQILQRYFKKINVWRMFPELKLLLTHVPVHESSLFRGASGNEQNPPKLLNVHGHIHDKPSPSDSHLCVCVEQTDYRPINIDELGRE